MKTVAYLVVLASLTCIPTTAIAQRARKMPRAEEMAVANYINVLRACCMPDGGINMTPCGSAADSPVWIAPYFGDHVALALLAANDRKQNDADVELVRKWIEWRVSRQESGGFWYDYVGTNASYHSNGKVDAFDSSAACFLLVMERFQRAGGVITQSMRDAAKASLACIESVTDSDGLTWAKPDYKVKFLMDNIELYAGLKSGEVLFSKTQDSAEATKCADQSNKVGRLLLNYRKEPDVSLFAWVLHPNGQFETGMEKLYPHGLAQLFGIAFVKPDRELFARIEKAFEPEFGPTATGPERFLITASRLGGPTEKKWRSKVIHDRSLTLPSTYSYRPALAILGLCEGVDWMPSP